MDQVREKAAKKTKPTDVKVSLARLPTLMLAGIEAAALSTDGKHSTQANSKTEDQLSDRALRVKRRHLNKSDSLAKKKKSQ